MSGTPVYIHRSKQPRRPHHIVDWAEKYGHSQADISAQLDVDKATVSRWFSGSTPNVESQAKLAALFHIEPEALFRHPDDDWLARFLRGRPPEEVERIKSTLEAAFPRKKTG
ncbi:helix-turn-helix transcriptional regulator [Pararhodobacter sp.]|uniref:helix-turn-helix transcriptional regulator n=1 Tax=Pararhodobacter sp. TaxID=2127056 RepID=UPI003A599325